MRNMILYLGLLAAFVLPIPMQAQSPPPPACTGVLYKEVAKGDTITACFDYPDADRAKVKYFRVRRSQTPAGAYLQFMKLVPSTTSFQFTATISCHIFITTVWDETQPDGSIITRESPGSNHIQILVK